jgi:hypothetical protein
MIAGGSTCINQVNDRGRKPRLLITADTTVSVKDTILLHARTWAEGSRAVTYRWRVDGRTASPDSDSVFVLYFGITDTGRHSVTVIGYGELGVPSDPETVHVAVLLNPPMLRMLTRDTTIFANDSLVIRAAASDKNGFIARYLWSIDSAGYTVATDSAWCTAGWGERGGRHVVRAAAMDDDSLMSTPESMLVTVRLTTPAVLAMRDTAVAVNDTLGIFAERTDTFTTTARYVWAKNGRDFSDTTSAGSIPVVFGRLLAGKRQVLVKAVDSHRLESNIDTVRVTVHLYAPTVSIIHDTAVAINDTIVLHATASDTNGRIVSYVWALAGKAYPETTTTGSIPLRFTKADTGIHVIKVTAIDDDTLLSNIDSVNLMVRMKPPPTVRCMGDTAVFINDTVMVHAQGTMSGSKSPIVAYVWARDGGAFNDTTATGILALRFTPSGAGNHTIKVKAVDRDTMESLADSVTVTVRLGMPVVKHIRDTSAVRGDTVAVTISASDTNGTITKYYWDIGGKGWSDSSNSPSRPITTARHSVLTVVVGARDDDGNIATDTFTVSFSAVACSVTVSGPLWRDTLYMHSVDLPLGKAAFSYSARRKDALADSFTYSIACGKSVAEFVNRYSGKDTSCTVPAFDTGKSYYRLVAVSSHNDSAQVVDSVFAVWQRQVCFIGHSIVTGMGGTPDSGGFRRIVIDTLRSLSPSKKQLRIVGPLYSNCLQPPEDDSSLAEAGRKSVDIFDSLFNYPSLAADAWVYMMGANDGYSYYGWYYTVATIDFMHGRNPKGEIYVLSPIPLPHDTTGGGYIISSQFRADLVTFNRMLDSAVTVRRLSWQGRQEGGVWMVDVYSPMALWPDSAYNPVYFNDFIHPNQKGYTLMGNRIIQTIKANTKMFK